MPTSQDFSAIVYLFDAKTAFARLQRFYTATNAAALGGLEGFVLAYRNTLLTTLAQIEIFPQSPSFLFPALLRSAETAGSFDGLESVFLTLLNSVAASGDQKTFNQALSVWKKLGSVTSAPNTSTIQSYESVLFYNVADKNLVFLTFNTLARLRPNGSNFGSQQESDRAACSCGFAESNKFGLGGGHASFEEIQHSPREDGPTPMKVFYRNSFGMQVMILGSGGLLRMTTATLFRRIKRLERSIPATTPAVESPLPQIIRRLIAAIANLDVCESARLSAEDKLIDQSVEAIRQFVAEHGEFRRSSDLAQTRKEIMTAFDGADEVRYRFARRLLELDRSTVATGHGVCIVSPIAESTQNRRRQFSELAADIRH